MDFLLGLSAHGVLKNNMAVYKLKRFSGMSWSVLFIFFPEAEGIFKLLCKGSTNRKDVKKTIQKFHVGFFQRKIAHQNEIIFLLLEILRIISDMNRQVEKLIIVIKLRSCVTEGKETQSRNFFSVLCVCMCVWNGWIFPWFSWKNLWNHF